MSQLNIPFIARSISSVQLVARIKGVNEII